MTAPAPAEFLAAGPTLPTLDGVSRNMLSGVTPVVFVGFGVLFVVVIWALFLRRSPRDPRDRFLTDDAPSSGRRRRRRPRREHRPTNPTLAETGGLPPAKSEAARKTEA